MEDPSDSTTAVGRPPCATSLSTVKLCDLRSKVMGIPGALIAVDLAIEEAAIALPFAIPAGDEPFATTPAAAEARYAE